MIYVYGLSYRVASYAKKSLDSIIANASEPIRIIVGDNPSPKSIETVSLLQEYKAGHKISSYLLFEKNIKTRAFLKMYQALPPDDECDFFVFTELDLVVPTGLDWIQELKAMRRLGAVDCGFSLSLSNYVPPNSGHDPDLNGHAMGIWLLGIDNLIFRKTYPMNGPFTDTLLHAHMSQFGKKIRSRKELYHLGWDLWRDDPDYWKLKLDVYNNGIGSSYRTYWQHLDDSAFSLY